ncbi:MAG: hypothetical protein SGJ27_02670 [Candidatus Melainabacteria bacterium]|nr:hypothetical protein [Candidatus Melainabacteria bacterium]
MIVAAFEEWYQNTNGELVKEFLFEDLWARIQPRIQKWENRGYQVCGVSDDGLMYAFRDQMNRGLRITEFHDEDFESLQYIEDVDSHDWLVFISERSTRTLGFLRTQAWTRIGVKRLAVREYSETITDGEQSIEEIRKQIVLTLAEEEGGRIEALESSSIEEIEERTSIAHMRIQMAVFGQD